MGVDSMRAPAVMLLGQTMEELTEQLGAPTERKGAVHRFGPDVAIEMEGGRAMRILVRVAKGLDFMEAVRREGFEDASAPILHVDRCEWPSISRMHRLEPEGRIAGRLDLETGVLELRLR